MPLFRPSILISDAYGSAGSVTFYHRNGRCYTRKRTKASYPGTPAQLEHLAIHRRAMAAWASLSPETQKEWISYGKTAEPHRPPLVSFPPFAVEFLDAFVEQGVLCLRVDTHVMPHECGRRYRLYVRLRLTQPGRGYGVRGMKGFLAEGDCSGLMTIRIPAYTEIWNLHHESFQIQAQSILLDSETGFRSQCQRTSAVIQPNHQ